MPGGLPLFSTEHPYGPHAVRVSAYPVDASGEDQYAILASCKQSIARSMIEADEALFCRLLGIEYKRIERTDEEWNAVFEARNKAYAKDRRKTEKRRHAHAQMWLDIYSPGVKYDPKLHWIALPEEEEESDAWE